MAAITIDKLSDRVGAEVSGVDCERLVGDDAFPPREMHRTTLVGDEPIA